jgi:16S rRNA (guanine(527)-N(7))-methyltransferase RsmG/RNA polymerase-binding protein DksA
LSVSGGGSLKRALEREGIFLDGEALERLERFAALLEEWNGVHNLTGARDRETMIKNIVDSLVPTGFVKAPESLLDVGTGAGFPGLILAVAWPGTETVLCEPLNKRAAFLRLAAMELGLERVAVEKRRVEELRHAPFGLISSRAVSDTALLLKLTAHLADERTRWLLYKGSRLEEELEGLEGFGGIRIHERPPRRYLLLSRSRTPGKSEGKRAMISEAFEGQSKGDIMAQRSDLDLEHFRKILMAERERLLKEIESVASDTQALDAAAEGAEDLGDVAELDAQNAIDQRLLEDLQGRLEEVEAALKRIEEGSYGICEKTGRPIPVERLEAYPAARTVVDAG